MSLPRTFVVPIALAPKTRLHTMTYSCDKGGHPEPAGMMDVWNETGATLPAGTRVNVAQCREGDLKGEWLVDAASLPAGLLPSAEEPTADVTDSEAEESDINADAPEPTPAAG